MTMYTLVVSGLPLLLQVAATTAAAANIALPGCESKCGDIDVPYPFGTTARCYRPGFKVTCHRSRARPPRLTLGSGRHGRQVLEISVPNSTVRIRSSVWYFSTGDTSTARLQVVHAGLPYVVSAARNRLVHVGCGFRAVSWTPGAPASSSSSSSSSSGAPRRTCSSSCPEREAQLIRRYRCDGIGCCDAAMPAGALITSFRARLEWTSNRTKLGRRSDSSSWLASEARMVVVEHAWWHDAMNLFMLKVSLLAAGRASGLPIPAVLDWAFDNSSTCAEAAKRSDFGCVSRHSECHKSTGSAHGYVCRCRHGYQGNPYVRDGCQSPRKHVPIWAIFGAGASVGICVLVLVFATTIFATKKLADKRAKKMREYFFKQNRGLLLQQLVDKDIAERMIFSLEELENATNKFDKARILGGGGHGMVYKGILSDQHVVAIKRSKLVIQREIDGFINEVAILSQINHRSVVKLFGCCLETEVPLLVYEFIPNGTLYSHLHVNSALSLSWKDRLRTALEVASSLAYLHSAASISIVHRDIKTSNILLDDRLTAKVSDFGASRGIAIEKSGVSTAIQGTYGYLDPEYFYTRRLTEKSDVYSYGVMLVELLTTRNKPTVEMSLDGVSLVAHFMLLLSEDRLGEILDVQVIEEGENEAKQVAAIAALCLQMKGDDRPTMRHVEMRLRGLQCSDYKFQKIPGEQEVRTGPSNTPIQGYNTVVEQQ